MILKSSRVDCDSCCAFGDEDSSLREVRRRLHRAGWYMRDGVDLCPDCKDGEPTEDDDEAESALAKPAS